MDNYCHRLWVAVVASALWFGCEAPQTAAKSERIMVTDSIEFAPTIAVEGEHLVLRYEVHNRGSRDLYLLNRLYRTTPTWTMDANVIYVHLDPSNRVVALKKRVPDIPSHVDPTAPVAPFVSPVRAGSTFRETVRVPLPVRDYREYGSRAGGPSLAALRASPVRVTYRAVTFELGYYWRGTGMAEEVREIHGAEVVVPINPPGAGSPEFGELRSDLVELAVPVDEYREP